jgi:hypothetical protein
MSERSVITHPAVGGRAETVACGERAFWFFYFGFRGGG